MQAKTRKIVSLISALALLVTCAISGLVLPAAADGSGTTETVVFYRDFEEYTDGQATDWKDAWGGGDLFAVEDEDGNTYIQLEAGANVVGQSHLVTFKPGEWFRISFKARNNSTSVVGLKPEIRGTFGTLDSGKHAYPQLEMPAAAAEGEGEWFEYTVYLQASRPGDKVWYLFIPAVQGGATIDLDDIKAEKVLDSGNLYGKNLLNGGDFEDGKAVSLNGFGHDGLFAQGGAIVDDGGNKVLHMTANGAETFFRNDVSLTETANSGCGYYMMTNSYYKLTYRQKGTGTTALTVNADNGELIAVEGKPEAASASWKTVTAYYQYTGAATHDVANQFVGFQTTGDVYLDDFVLEEITAEDLPEDTIVFSRDFEEYADGQATDWNNNWGGSGLFAVEDEDGNTYIQLEAGSNVVGQNNLITFEAGEWFRISFKARNNSTSAVALNPEFRGMFGTVDSGKHAYPQLSMPAASAEGEGEWFEYTMYMQPSRPVTGKVWYIFIPAVKGGATIDLDDIEVEKVRKSDEDALGLNLLYGGDFENGKVVSLEGFGHDGLFAQGGAIVDDGGNKVLHMTENGTETFIRPDVSLTEAANSGCGYYLMTNSYYKLTYRQKGAGTTALTVNADNGELIAVEGEPETASSEWKTVTAYYQYTGVATHALENQFIGFQTTGDVYLDDFVLEEITAEELPDTSIIFSRDFEEYADGQATDWNNNWGGSGLFAVEDEDGNTYIQLEAGSNVVGQSHLVAFKPGEWFRISFKARNNSTSVVGLKPELRGTFGTLDSGKHAYPQLEMPAAAAEGEGEWFEYTVYLQASRPGDKVWYLFIPAVQGGATIDLDDIEVQLVRKSDEDALGLNLLYGGDFENGKVVSLEGFGHDGLFAQGGAIVDDGDNKVLHMTENGTETFIRPDVSLTEAANSGCGYYLMTNSYYKLTYRQKGAGTTALTVNADNGELIAVEGEPETASSEWKTVTAYYQYTGVATHALENQFIGFQTTGDVYLDDFVLEEITADEVPDTSIIFSRDFEEYADGQATDWNNNWGGSGLIAKEDADGNTYIQLEAGANVVGQNNLITFEAGEWYRISFKARNNSTSAVALNPEFRGMFGTVDSGKHAYPQLSMPAASAEGEGEWFEYTMYMQPSRPVTGKVWYIFIPAVKGGATIDMDDIEVQLVRKSDEDALGLNLLYGGDFEDGKPVSLEGFDHDGLFAQGGAIVDDGGNKVLHMTANGTETFIRNDVSLTEAANSGCGYYLMTNSYYKLTYRQKGAGATALTVNTDNGKLIAVEGAPDAASDEWKTITAYYQYTGAASHDVTNQFIGFRTTGDVYLDDFVLQEVSVDEVPADKVIFKHDFEEYDENENTAWNNAWGGDPLPAMKDADGNTYIQAPADKAAVSQNNLVEVVIGAWYRISFKARNNTTSVAKVDLELRGIFGTEASGSHAYPQIEMPAASAEGQGEWIQYNFYIQPSRPGLGKVWYMFFDPKVTIDLDDIEVVQVRDNDNAYGLNLLYGGDFESGNVASLNGFEFNGLFAQDGEIVDDGGNKVLHITADTNTFFRNDLSVNKTVWAGYYMNTNSFYMLTYRQKGTGTTALTVNADNGTLLTVKGEPGTASDEWKTITAYYEYTGEATHDAANQFLGFQTTGDVYLDDFVLQEIPATDVPVTSIALENTELGVGGSKTLVVTTVPALSNLGALTWESSDPSIIKVDANGVVTAVAGEGSVTITASTGDGALSASCTVTIAGDYATAIELNLTQYYAKKNSTLQLKMSTVPANGLYKKPVWSSNNETVATVDQNGLVTVLDAEGTAIITVTSGDLTDTCEVIVPGKAQNFEFKNETVTLAPPVGSITVSDTLEFVVTPPNSELGTLTWTSSDETVATVDANGKVTALKEGETTITATDGTITDTCVIKVAYDGERITGGDFENNDWNVPSWTTNIIKDGKGYVAADPADSNNLVLALPNDNATLEPLWLTGIPVNVTRTYKLTFKVKGDGVTADQQLAANFDATATNNGGYKYVNTITGEWKTVSYIFTANALSDVMFGIDNNKQGVLYLDDFSLIELPPATKLSIGDTEKVEILPLGELPLSIRTEPAEASAGVLTWESSDPSIIAVDAATGKLTAYAKEGSVTITVKNDAGLTDTVEVVISDYAELLVNGDFEQGDLNWKGDYPATVLPGVGKDGSAGLVLDIGETNKGWYYKGLLDMQPATTYVLEWDYIMTEDASFRIYAAYINLSEYASKENIGEWHHHTRVFTTKADMIDITNSANKGWVFAIISDMMGSDAPSIVDNVSLKLYNSGVEAESISMNKDTLMMLPGRTDTLSIMATPTNGDTNRAIWTSSNEDVATVEYGIVTAVGKGTATITAETRNGKKATCEVTVSGEPAFVTNGTFEDTEDDAWIMGGDAAITENTGVQGTNSGTLITNETSTLSQKVTGLKPATTYELFVRYRGAASGAMSISLLNGEEETRLFRKSVNVSTSWTKSVYEFTTPDVLDEESILTFAKISGAGEIWIDNVILAQKASMADLVVENLIWDGGNEQVTPGTELTFYVMLKNQGTDPIKAGPVIATDICVDGKPIQTINYQVNADIAIGASFMVSGTTPWAAVEGDHVISARVNSTLSVLEFDISNNYHFQTNLRVNDEILEIPEVAEKAGFDTLSFSDDFNNAGLIDSGDTRMDGYKWYVSRPYGMSSATAADYFVKDGVLTLANTDGSSITLNTVEYKSGVGFTYNTGYMEVRIRIPEPHDDTEGYPAIWSLPLDTLRNGEDVPPWVEMDWMEFWGFAGGQDEDGYFTITMHDQARNADGSQEHWYRNSNNHQTGLGDGEWHTLGWLWAQNAVVAYLDGEMIFHQAYDAEDFPNPMMDVIKAGASDGTGAFSVMNEQWLPVIISGTADNPLEMDYIRIWTGMGGGTIDTPDQGGTVVDMTAEDFWYNYCTDMWGDPIVEATEENYMNILGLNAETGEYEAADLWERLSDERRAEINALLESLGQPSYDELLAAALVIAEGGEPGEPDEPGEDEPGEDSPDTGERTVMPAVVATAMLLSAAVLWISRKRKKTNV